MKSLYSCKIVICGRNLSLAKISKHPPSWFLNITEISCIQKKWDPFKLRRRVSLPQKFVETWLICIKEILVYSSKIWQYRKNYIAHNCFTFFLSPSTTFHQNWEFPSAFLCPHFVNMVSWSASNVRRFSRSNYLEIGKKQSRILFALNVLWNMWQALQEITFWMPHSHYHINCLCHDSLGLSKCLGTCWASQESNTGQGKVGL